MARGGETEKVRERESFDFSTLIVKFVFFSLTLGFIAFFVFGIYLLIIPFGISMILALALSPLINHLERYNIPRIAGTLLVIGGLVAVGYLLYLLLFPVFSAEIAAFEKNIDQYKISAIKKWGQMLFIGKDVIDMLRSYGAQVDDNTLAQSLEKVFKNVSAALKKAGEGAVIVRLKGGDPYIFGRGGEEASALFDAGIPFEVVPGVTAASGVAAYAGIPLTDRRYASAVTFITGHRRNGDDLAEIDWKSLAGGDNTLVFYMGLKNIRTITKNLVENGRSIDSPAAVVRCGTMPAQVSIEGSLADIADLVEKNNIEPPALLVVGEVIRLRPSLRWFGECGGSKEDVQGAAPSL